MSDQIKFNDNFGKKIKKYSEIKDHIDAIGVDLFSLDIKNFENEDSALKLLSFDINQFALLRRDIGRLEKIKKELGEYGDDYFEMYRLNPDIAKILNDGINDDNDNNRLESNISKLKERIKDQKNSVESKILEFGTVELKCMYSFVFNFYIAKFGLDLAMQYLGILGDKDGLVDYTNRITDHDIDKVKNKSMLHTLLGIYEWVRKVPFDKIDSENSEYVEMTSEQKIALELYNDGRFGEDVNFVKTEYTDKCRELVHILGEINFYYKKNNSDIAK